MTIGIDIRSLSGGAYTGVGEYTRNLLKYIIPLDKNIQFKLFFNAHGQKPDLSYLDGAQNIKPYFFSYPNKYFSATNRFLNRPKIDKMIAGCDVFFSPHFISAPISASCRKVITFHDLSFERYPEFFDTTRKLWHFSNNPKRQAKEADRIIAVSESTAYDLADIYGVDSKKVSIVYSGINEEFFREQTREELWHVRAKYNLPERFMLSLSTIEPRKNVFGTIKAFELLKESNPLDIKLVIAGKPGWLYRDTFNGIKNSKYKNDIMYIGFIEDSDKPAVYKLAELFVYPSIYEGFGFPPLEAMAAGTPVITSACSSLPEVVEDAALLVDPFNISDIAWMMEEVTKDKYLAEYLREKGLAQARKFTWQKCAEETLQALKN
ncbi:MAG: glycosyltransferase family 1 protein [Candidatus Spechtbacterales bacterium]